MPNKPTYEFAEILLVEDNKDDEALFLLSLKKKNLANQIFVVRDGEEAKNFLLSEGEFSGNNNPCLKLILLDLKLPKIDGLELLQLIKTHPKLKHIPVVILTSSDQDPDIKKAYAFGANSYVVKPIDFNKFQDTAVSIGLYWATVNKV